MQPTVFLPNLLTVPICINQFPRLYTDRDQLPLQPEFGQLTDSVR